MPRSSLTRSTVAALMIAAGCGWAAGTLASPVAGMANAAQSVAPLVERAAHQPNHWQWHGGWWRYGPWAKHAIQGAVIVRPWPSVVFVPWGAERLRHCAARYRSFDPATGTYVTGRGERRICR